MRILSCTLTFAANEKCLSQYLHLYGFSPVWVLLCSFNLCASLNILPHCMHPKGFSPVWIIMCCLRWHDLQNRLSHWVHWNGFSPVWILSGFLRSPIAKEENSQCLHLYGLTPACLFSCCLQLPGWLKDFSHIWHLFGFTPVWICWWNFPYYKSVKLLVTSLALKIFLHSVSFSVAVTSWGAAEILMANIALVRFSPVCILSWHIKWSDLLNFFSHCPHLNGFSSECTTAWCDFMFTFWEKHLPHYLQTNGFSPVCSFLCFKRLAEELRHFPHVLQEYLPRENGLHPLFFSVVLKQISFLDCCPSFFNQLPLFSSCWQLLHDLQNRIQIIL